jgi:hypothetical protein
MYSVFCGLAINLLQIQIYFHVKEKHDEEIDVRVNSTIGLLILFKFLSYINWFLTSATFQRAKPFSQSR